MRVNMEADFYRRSLTTTTPNRIFLYRELDRYAAGTAPLGGSGVLPVWKLRQ